MARGTDRPDVPSRHGLPGGEGASAGAAVHASLGMGLFQALNLFLVWDFAGSAQPAMPAGASWYMAFALSTIAGCLLLGAWGLAAWRREARAARQGARAARREARPAAASARGTETSAPGAPEQLPARPAAPTPLAASRLSCACAVLGAAAGIACAQGAAGSGAASAALALSSAALLGFSIAGFSLVWACALAAMPEMARLGSLAAAALLCLPVLFADLAAGPAWYPALLALLAGGSAWLASEAACRCEAAPAAALAAPVAGPAGAPATPEAAPVAGPAGAPAAPEAASRPGRAAAPGRPASSVLPELLCAFAVSVVVFLERTLFPAQDMAGLGLSLLDDQRLVLLERALSAAALLLVWLPLGRRPTCASSFAFVFPLLALLVLAPLLGPGGSLFASVASGTVYVAFAILVRTTAIDLAAETGAPLSAVFCALLAALLSGMPVGRALGALLAGSGLADETTALLSALILIYIMLTVLYFLFRSRTRGRWRPLRNPAEAPGRSGLQESAIGFCAQGGLSERQAEIVALVAQGYDAPSIAGKLSLSENTVRTHLKRIYQRLGIHSKQELVELVAAWGSPQGERAPAQGLSPGTRDTPQANSHHPR